MPVSHSYLPVHGQVQIPDVYLYESVGIVEEAFIDIPVKKKLKFCNSTLLSASLRFVKVCKLIFFVCCNAMLGFFEQSSGCWTEEESQEEWKKFKEVQQEKRNYGCSTILRTWYRDNASK